MQEFLEVSQSRLGKSFDHVPGLKEQLWKLKNSGLNLSRTVTVSIYQALPMSQTLCEPLYVQYSF